MGALKDRWQGNAMFDHNPMKDGKEESVRGIDTVILARGAGHLDE
jgi:hypothetical protein